LLYTHYNSNLRVAACLPFRENMPFFEKWPRRFELEAVLLNINQWLLAPPFAFSSDKNIRTQGV
jgi:hypothetical protein